MRFFNLAEAKFFFATGSGFSNNTTLLGYGPGSQLLIAHEK
jgi:hypothetical protein